MSPVQLTAKQWGFQRLRMVKAIAARRESVTVIALQYGVSRKTAYKWYHRWWREAAPWTRYASAPASARLANATATANCSDWRISSLSHQAIRVLRSTPGMTSVLVGMRRCAYFDDILQELRQPCVAEDRRTAWEELVG